MLARARICVSSYRTHKSYLAILIQLFFLSVSLFLRFFAALNWVESPSWNGKYAVVLAGDVAVYEAGPARPTGGAGMVAMLIGKDAPITVDTRHLTSHMGKWK
jgi:hypothetical protein